MIEALISYIKDENLFSPADKLILAVSGGVDSMVMLDLFQQLDYDFVVAHCNFHLRGAESDGEEIFMRDYCGEKGIELYVKHFETREHAVITGTSVEMAARKLRYDWFAELLDDLSYDYLVTAHHQDDLIETMLINLSRGTGIRGLTGIAPKNGRTIRPLLFANRQQIVSYASAHNVPFKNDSSNDELLYRRNMIRHRIIPLFEEINAGFRKNAIKTASVLKGTEKVYQQKLDEVRKEVVTQSGINYLLSIEQLSLLDPLHAFLFEMLYPFGFNGRQVREIADAFNAEAGKIFFSRTHRLVKDRDNLIVTPRGTDGSALFYIENDCLEITRPLHLSFEIIDRKPDFQFSRNPWIVDVDYDRLIFPLILKRWETGEYFQPLGMSGFKKISDYFVDEKMSIPEKDEAWILYSSKTVVWIIGRRIDDRFKITDKTTRILRIKN